MEIKKLVIKNFRLLKDIEIDLEKDLSLIIGKNNCGKTSVLYVLKKFLGEHNDASGFKYEDFNIDFRLELPHIDEICEGEVHVLKERVKLIDQMQVFCHFLVKPFVPIGRRAVHTNKRIKGVIFISWEC